MACGPSVSKTTPGAMSVYCNDCYTLAEIVIQRVAGRPYTEHVTDAVLVPLGMTHTRFPTDYFPAGSYAPVLTPDGALPQEFLSLPGSGSVYSTPSDMAHLATMLMAGGTYGGKRILSAASIAEMGRDQIVSTLDPVKDNEYRYGLGWDSVREPGLAAVGVGAWVKGGDSTDYHAGFTVAPKAKLAAVVQIAGVTASSAQAQTLGQTLILRALVERGDLGAMPRATSAKGLPARMPTAAQLRAIEGIYLAGGGAYRLEANTKGALTFARFLGDDWTPSPASFTLRSDGRFWDTKTGTKAFAIATGWGRRYLVLRQVAGYGHYQTDTVLGERLSPGPALTAAWKARLGTTYVFTTEVASSTGWQAPGMSLREIPGLEGYLYAAVAGNPVPVDPATSDTMGAMTVVIPAMQGRDLNDVEIVTRDGQEWVLMGSTLRRPLDRAPSAGKGSTAVGIADGAVAEWVKIAQTGSVTTTGADAWKTFDADLAQTGEGTGDASGLHLDGGFLVVFGDSGSDVRVAIE